MIKTEHLYKRFDKFTALDDINATISDGCIYGMVGSNGAGKSTFLRVISGVYKEDGGSVTVDGVPIYENPEAKKRIVFVPDELFTLPGANMDRMADMYEAFYPCFDRKKYQVLAKDFSLDRKKPLNTFSKGMRRQATIILSLASQPEYIFFDETFDGLDPIMRNYVKKLISSEVLERGASAIITSHSLRELEDTCDQLALLHKGGLVLESDIQNLKTEQFKIQVAFSNNYYKEMFEGIDIVHFSKHGAVSNMIVRGSKDETVRKIAQMNPMLLEVLPLSLEEIFTYEMEALGYSFDVE